MRLWPIIGVALVIAVIAEARSSDVEVVDGDTLVIDRTTYRLHGIDAPETNQTCLMASGEEWPCGRSATTALINLTSGIIVECHAMGQDVLSRQLAVCFADGENINAMLVRTGMAWAFRKYSHAFVPDEETARSQGVGIWQAANQAPWEYRAGRWKVNEQKAPNGCPIKGNISASGRIYHTPQSRYYSRTKIDQAKGERWFSSEAEARSAGWRKPN